MEPIAYVINTARGAIVDEPALVQAPRDARYLRFSVALACLGRSLGVTSA